MPDVVFLDPHASSDVAAWQALWQRAEGRSPFTHARLVATVADATGRRPWLVGVEDEGELVAGCVLYTAPSRPWLAAPAPLTRYTGVLLCPPIEERHVPGRSTALDALLAGIQRNFRVAALSLTPATADARPLQWSGFSCTPRYTYRLPAAVPYVPNRLVRRHLRAARFDIEQGVLDDEGVALLDRHYSERAQAPPLSPAAHRHLLHALHDLGLLAAWVLRDEHGAAVAAATTLSDDQAAYMWTAGSVPGPAMTVLQHTLIEKAHASARDVDLLGANVASIAQFKAHFRGTLVQHFHAVYHRHRVLRLLHAIRPFA